MTAPKGKNNARAAAARAYMREHPGTSYTTALRRVDEQTSPANTDPALGGSGDTELAALTEFGRGPLITGLSHQLTHNSWARSELISAPPGHGKTVTAFAEILEGARQGVPQVVLAPKAERYFTTLSAAAETIEGIDSVQLVDLQAIGLDWSQCQEEDAVVHGRRTMDASLAWASSGTDGYSHGFEATALREAWGDMEPHPPALHDVGNRLLSIIEANHSRDTAVLRELAEVLQHADYGPYGALRRAPQLLPQPGPHQIAVVEVESSPYSSDHWNGGLGFVASLVYYEVYRNTPVKGALTIDPVFGYDFEDTALDVYEQLTIQAGKGGPRVRCLSKRDWRFWQGNRSWELFDVARIAPAESARGGFDTMARGQSSAERAVPAPEAFQVYNANAGWLGRR